MEVAGIDVPEVGFTDFVKCVTRSGRQSLAEKLIKPFTRIGNISSVVSNGIADLVDAGTEKLGDARCAQIVKGCAVVETCCNLVKSSISPEGKGGKNITPEERADIIAAVTTGFTCLTSQAEIDAAVSKIIEKVP